MEGSNGSRGSSWRSYFQKIGSNGNSSSGTIVSTAYTSSASRFSSLSIEAAAAHFDCLGIDEEEEDDGKKLDDWEEAEEEETGEEEEEDLIRSLVQKFFSAQSANCSINRDDMSVVERWVILSLEHGVSSGKELDCDARSWTRVLDQIEQTICFTRPLLPDGANSLCAEQGKHAGVRCVPDRYRLALVIQETLLKILTFVDIVAAWDPNTTQELRLSVDRVMLPPYNKLNSLLGAHGALSEASYMILTQIHRSTSAQVRRIENEMDILLSTYKNKLVEAIRSTMEMIRTKSMEDGDDSSSPQGSSDIHKVTRCVMTYIRFLCANYSSVDAAIRGEYVPHIKNVRPLDGMIVEMVSCLQEKLASISKSFSDQGLMFLFLLNNSYFIREQLRYSNSYNFTRPMILDVDLTRSIDLYTKCYLQVLSASLQSSLLKTLWWEKNSPLSKFESEFLKIFATQKQWKVPDPELRRLLHEAVTSRIITVFREYIEVNKALNPKTSPLELELEVMLQELFEG